MNEEKPIEMTDERLVEIEARAKEGGHYAKWLFVWELIAAIKQLKSERTGK